jgi:hypothetical protein
MQNQTAVQEHRANQTQQRLSIAGVALAYMMPFTLLAQLRDFARAGKRVVKIQDFTQRSSLQDVEATTISALACIAAAQALANASKEEDSIMRGSVKSIARICVEIDYYLSESES